MNTKTRDNEQYLRLHSEFVPGLYRIAFYLLGDGETARLATARAWEAAYADPGRRADQRLLRPDAERRLVEQCFLLQRNVARYETTTPDGMDQPLLGVLAALRFDDRALLVLAAMQGRCPAEISAILRQPVCLVEHRLHKLTARVCHANLALC